MELRLINKSFMAVKLKSPWIFQLWDVHCCMSKGAKHLKISDRKFQFVSGELLLALHSSDIVSDKATRGFAFLGYTRPFRPLRSFVSRFPWRWHVALLISSSLLQFHLLRVLAIKPHWVQSQLACCYMAALKLVEVTPWSSYYNLLFACTRHLV